MATGRLTALQMSFIIDCIIIADAELRHASRQPITCLALPLAWLKEASLSDVEVELEAVR